MNLKNFYFAVEIILKREGGLVDNPNDRGGITNFGISLRAYPELGRQGIKTLTRWTAIEMYRRDYWMPSGADSCAWPLCLAVFDAAVNNGVGRARKWLREAKVLTSDPKEIALEILKQRESFYKQIVEKNKKQSVFLKGWLARNAHIIKEVNKRLLT